MIDLRQDILSLTEFKRNSARLISRMRKSGRPLVLTVNGRAEVVALDAGAYQRMLELLDRAEAIEGVRRGLGEVEKGRTVPAAQAHRRLRKKHGLSG